MKISAFLPVYNEEKRIRYTLQSLQWCDEIIVLDKTSTDKTVEICKSYGAKVFIIPNSDKFDISEFEYLKECSGDWILRATASDIIDYSLAMEIRKQAEIVPDDIGCINVPFKNYILGIEDKRSPWHGSPRKGIFRNNNYKISNDVHGAFSLINYKSYTIPEKYGYYRHLSHVSVDMMLERHTRYWRGEAAMYNERTLIPSFEKFWEAVKLTVKTRKTFFLGWDGIALTFAYVSYFMFSFLYTWEYRRKNKAENIYYELREKNQKSWECLENNKNTETIDVCK